MFDTRAVRRLQVTDLELFAHVADAGSITHGAARAHLSLPAASARISQMEQTVGVRLLERGRRGVVPTPAGHLVRRHAGAVLGQLDELGNALADHSRALHARVGLHASSAALATWLPERVIGFLATHPGVNVDLTEASSRRAVQAVHDGAADLAVVADTIGGARLERREVGEDVLVLVTAAADPLASAGPVTIDAAMTRSFVGLAEGRTEAQHYAAATAPSPPLNYRVKLGTVDAVCAAVAAGVGVSVLPLAAVEPLRDRHRLAVVELRDAWARRRMLLCARAFDDLSEAAGALAAAIA